MWQLIDILILPGYIRSGMVSRPETHRRTNALVQPKRFCRHAASAATYTALLLVHQSTRQHTQRRAESNRESVGTRTEDRVDARLEVDRLLVRGPEPRAVVVRAEVDVRARDAPDALDVRVHDRAAEEVQVEVVLRTESAWRAAQGEDVTEGNTNLVISW